MSTHVVNEFRALPGRGDDVLALLAELSAVSRTQPGCAAISLRRNQDDRDNIIGDTRWATRQDYDNYLAWRTANGFTARFDEMPAHPWRSATSTKHKPGNSACDVRSAGGASRADRSACPQPPFGTGWLPQVHPVFVGS